MLPETTREVLFLAAGMLVVVTMWLYEKYKEFRKKHDKS